MPIWQVATSSAAGALITLIGVFAGAILSGRHQQRQWARDKQIKACSDVIVESTRVQRALWRRWAHGEEVQWHSWNEALAELWLFGTPELINSAKRIDENFFHYSQLIKNGEVEVTNDWIQARGKMGGDKLDFINKARTHVLKYNGSAITKALGGWPKWSATSPPDSRVD